MISLRTDQTLPATPKTLGNEGRHFSERKIRIILPGGYEQLREKKYGGAPPSQGGGVWSVSVCFFSGSGMLSYCIPVANLDAWSSKGCAPLTVWWMIGWCCMAAPCTRTGNGRAGKVTGTTGTGIVHFRHAGKRGSVFRHCFPARGLDFPRPLSHASPHLTRPHPLINWSHAGRAYPVIVRPLIEPDGSGRGRGWLPLPFGPF